MSKINGVSWAYFLGTGPPDPRSVDWIPCDHKGCPAPMRADGTACTSGRPHRIDAPQTRLYATWTGTRRNLSAIHKAQGRLLLGPDQLARLNRPPPLCWAIDNGAWGAHQKGEAFNADAFRATLNRWAYGADFVVVPDIVAGGLDSLTLSEAWLPEVLEHTDLALIAVQDGMSPEDIAPLLVNRHVGIFVGGSTEWKLATLPQWGELTRQTGCYLHVGRVNSAKRIRLAIDCGADSVDGTSLSKYATNAPRLGRASHSEPQPDLFHSCV